jgi:hypothetical protein
MPKQSELPGMETKSIRVTMPKAKRDKLNIIAAVRGTSVNAIINSLLDEFLSSSEELKKLDLWS